MTKIEKIILQLSIILSVLLFFSCSEDSNGAIVEGCTDTEACNYNNKANKDDSSCEYDIDIIGNCCVDNVVDCFGVCGGAYEFDDCEECQIPDGPFWNSSCSGCMDPPAINYDSLFTINANCAYDGFADTTQWELVWNDEFNLGYIDQSKWNHEEWGPGEYNNELQEYTDRSDNSYIEDSCLVIRANYDGENYTSARMTTRDKGDWLYGRIDVKAKLPSGDGTWPAIWMLGINLEWPACGEIDIMEHINAENVIHGSIHTSSCYFSMGDNYPGECPDYQLQSFNQINPDFPNTHKTNVNNITGWHIYGIEWDASSISFFIDGNIWMRVHNTYGGQPEWPFNQPFYIILNLAIGGNFPGDPDNSNFPHEMKVNFVRVYKSINE